MTRQQVANTIDGHAHRFKLVRDWSTLSQSTPTTLVFIGLNPSTADAVKDDSTVRLLVNYAQRANYTRLVVYNLYSLRATQPSELTRLARQGVNVIGSNNQFFDICNDLQSMDLICTQIVAGWGNNGLYRGHNLVLYMRSYFSHLYPLLRAFGVTSIGAPAHPLRRQLPDQLIRLPSWP